MSLKNSTPTISVIMSVYNEPEEWLRESINSILNQTFKDFEFIIINDKPERESNEKLLTEYKKNDKRIILIKNKKNIGLTKSLNKGLEIAKGKFIARMDGDDICFKNRFEKQIEFFKNNPDVSIVGTQATMFGEKDDLIIVPRKSSEIKARLFVFNVIVHSSVMMKKEDLLKHNLRYNENILKSQDYNLWARASKVVKISNLKLALIKYRVHSNQISNKNQEDQSFSANVVRTDQLRNLDINLDQKELFIYTKFFENEIEINISEIHVLDSIITAIIESNRSSEIYLRKDFEFLFLSRLTKYYLQKHLIKEFSKSKSIKLINLSHIIRWINYLLCNRLFTYFLKMNIALRND